MAGSNPNPQENAEEPEELGDLDTLRASGDMAGLLALAKARRAARDLPACLEAYRAAALLGSGEAEYAVALFLMTGSVVTQDLKEGTMRLRSAAEKGSIPAKIYLGNLYDLGVHYKADPEKADVWYRNAARAARIEAEPGSGEWNRGLADLGAARYVLLLANDPSVSADDKARMLVRAKAHGYGLAERERQSLVASMHEAEAAPVGVAVGAPRLEEPRERKDTSPETKQAKDKRSLAPSDPGVIPTKPKLDPHETTVADQKKKQRAVARTARLAGALGAFGYAILFMLAGLGAGYAASLGARELIAHGHPLPALGARTQLVFPIVLALVGVMPTALVYKFGTVLKALVLSAALAGAGWVAWGAGVTGRGAYHADRPLQALVFGIAGFLAGLLVLGLLGGAKTPSLGSVRARPRSS